MDYEQKYNGALEFIRKIYSSLSKAAKEEAEHYFSELKETEDERIRKDLMQLVKARANCNDVERMLAYLEKQKDPVVNGRGLYYYDGEKFTYCGYPATKDNPYDFAMSQQEKQKEQKPAENPMDIHNRGYVKGVEDAYNNVNEAKVILKRLAKENPKPAEWKPEPESLEALMYAIEGKWEMIKPTSYLSRRLEDLYEGVVNTFNVDESLVAHENDFTSKPAEWSEEDEKMKERIILLVEHAIQEMGGSVKYEEALEWLKSLRPQPKQEWSEEDEKILRTIISDGSRGVELDSKQIAWLKSLRPQPKAELTLLDENIINAAVAFVEQNDHFNFWCGIDKHAVIKALRSLKPHWKTSEYTLSLVKKVANGEMLTHMEQMAMETLCNDLQKLH